MSGSGGPAACVQAVGVEAHCEQLCGLGKSDAGPRREDPAWLLRSIGGAEGRILGEARGRTEKIPPEDLEGTAGGQKEGEGENLEEAY